MLMGMSEFNTFTHIYIIKYADLRIILTVKINVAINKFWINKLIILTLKIIMKIKITLLFRRTWVL